MIATLLGGICILWNIIATILFFVYPTDDAIYSYFPTWHVLYFFSDTII